MKTTLQAVFLTLALTLVRAAATSTSHDPAVPPETVFRAGLAAASQLESASTARFSATPKGFIPNLGQLPDQAVRFALRDRGTTAYFTDQGFVLWNGQTIEVTMDGQTQRVPVAPRWQLMGARTVQPVGGETFQHTVSFFKGNDPAGWHANVPAYRDLRYPEILEGVEMRVASRERGFEYSFHVQPHARPELRFRYDDVAAIEKTLTGDLIVRTATGHFTESRPVSFQWIDGKRHEVESCFELVSHNEYRIILGPYDERHELVIDPVLDWSTSVGGSHNEHLTVVKLDPNGDVIVAGITESTDLPTTSGSFNPDSGVNLGPDQVWQSDVYIAKFSADGTQLRWAGYLGGAGATSEAIGRNKSLAVDEAGDLYITTHTRSPDFPVWPAGNSTHQGETDASITRIKSDGSAILWSRLIGAAGEDYGYAVAVHGTDLYLSGITTSPNFPVTARTFQGMQDAFVAKLNAANGAVAWSSFLGGSLEERVAAIVADAGGVIVYGNTDSEDFHAPDFPAPALGHDRNLGGSNDAFLTKLAPSGEILWSTYLGGSHDETVYPTLPAPFTLSYAWTDVALDNSGNIVAVGLTSSTDFPGTAGRFQPALAGTRDAYVAKLTPGGSLLWASYLGGSAGTIGESASSVAINPWDEIFISGWTYTTSPTFPTTPDALKRVTQTEEFLDGFLTKIDKDGQQILYSTLIGNTGWNDAILGMDYGFGKVVVGGWHMDTFFQITAGTFRQECNNCGSETFLMDFLDAFVSHEGFESGNYSGGSDWSGNWTTSGDVSILTSSGPHSGSRHVRLRRGTGLLSRTVSLSPGVTTLTLGFWSKVHSFEGNEHANILVGVNGGSLTTVYTLTSAQADDSYHFYEVDLTGLLPAAQIQITFDANMGDPNDNWYLDDIRLTATAGSLPPIANAGPDQVVSNGDGTGLQTVFLNGSASSDPDGGGIITYEWKQGATVLGNEPIIAVNLPLGPHTITLTVTDNEDETATDTVQITVNPNQPPIANAGADQSITDSDNSGSEVVTLNGAASFDADGSIATYVWMEGATPLGNGVSISPSLAVGGHTITLTVTDNGGAMATDTVQVTVSAPSAQPTKSHVGDLDRSASNQGANWVATVVVTIHNNASTHPVVSGAMVTGTWSGGFTGTVSATTGSNGQCTFMSGQMPKKVGSVTFTINNVQHASLTYNAADNHDPDGDSNGTSITVNKP